MTATITTAATPASTSTAYQVATSVFLVHEKSLRLMDLTVMTPYRQRLVAVQALAAAHAEALKRMCSWAGVPEHQGQVMVSAAIDEFTRRVAQGQSSHNLGLLVEQIRYQFEQG